MTRLLLAATALLSTAAINARAAETPEGLAAIRGCITAAAEAYRFPPAVIVILLRVEGGSLGAVSQNTNNTVDIGPMQVNQIWVPQIAAHWGATQSATSRALRDNFCANVEAGSWILRKGLDEARGNFWEGVGYYHSHDPDHKAHYLRLVLDQALRLQAKANHPTMADSRSALPGRPRSSIVTAGD